MKIRLHCDGCIHKIEKIVLKAKGVESVNIEGGGKDLVTVKGTVEANELVPYLREKLKRNVEVVVVPPKKDDEKKENKQGGGGGEKKEGGGDKKEVESGTTKVEVNKMEHYGYGYAQQPPMYWHGGYAPGESSSGAGGGGGGYAVEGQGGYWNDGGYNGNSNYYQQQQQGGYMVEQPPPYYLHQQHPLPPQMFSDENPNACSVM